MNRRSFFKSCGGAVAALMLPFGVKMKLSAPKKAKAVELCPFWYESTRHSQAIDSRYYEYLKLLIKRSDEGLSLTKPLDLPEL